MNQVQSNILIAEYDMYSTHVNFTIGEGTQQRVQARLQMTLPSKCLTTHICLTLIDMEMISKYYTFLYAESLDNYESRAPLPQKVDLNQISMLLVTQRFRLVFNIEEKSQTLRYIIDRDMKEFEEMFKMTVSRIQIYGYQLYTSPPANQMVSILNASHFLKKHNQEMSAADSDILLGLCLIASRRFLQAAEIFKKVAMLYSQKAKQADPLNSEKLRLMASSLQILVADSINQPSMLNEKLQALILCVNFSRSTDLKVNFSDISEVVMRNHSDIIKVICKVIPSKMPFEALKMAHLRCLEFLIEQLGCELGEQIVGLIRLLAKNYNQSPQMNLKLLNNLQQTLQHSSSRLRICVWKDLVEQEIFQSYPTDIMSYYLKLAEYITEITEGEVPISMYFINQIVRTEDQNYTKLWNYINEYTIQYQTPKKIQKFIQWSVVNLQELIEFQAFTLENQHQANMSKRYLTLIKSGLKVLNIDHSNIKNSFLKQTFQAILSQTVSDRLSLRQIYRPEQINTQSILLPLKHLLQESVTKQINLEVVQLLMDVFQQLQNYDPQSPHVSQLLQPYLIKIMEFCRSSTPQLELLKLLHILLQTIKPQQMRQYLLEFLGVFCGCMPHSIYDETFLVFNQLVDLNIDYLDSRLISSCILALIDQYTVKGKAQKTAKSQLIKKLCQHENHLLNFLQVCFYSNQEPKMKKDEKVYNQEFEIFVEKLSIIQEALTDMQPEYFQFVAHEFGINVQMVDAFMDIVTSSNAKIRWKGLILLNTFYEDFIKYHQLKQTGEQLQLQDLIESSQCLVDRLTIQQNENFINNFLKLLCRSLQHSNDEKSLLQGLVLIDQIFASLLFSSEHDAYLEFCGHQTQNNNEAILRLILECWDQVVVNSNSQWQNVYTALCRVMQTWAKFQEIHEDRSMHMQFLSKMMNWIHQQIQKGDKNSVLSALRTCGTFLGLRISTLMAQHPEKSYLYFRRYQNLIPLQFWESICNLQLSTHHNIKWMSICILQCSAPSTVIINWFQTRYNQIPVEEISNQSSVMNDQSSFPPFNSINEQKTYHFSDTVNSYHVSISQDNASELWIKQIDVEHLAYILSILFEDSQPQPTEPRNQQLQDEEEPNLSFKEEKIKEIIKPAFLDDEPLDFDELGIIEVDDEEWNEYDDLRKVPILKGKMKTISPSQIKKEEVTRKWSGTVRNQTQPHEVKTDDTKLLRPHNPLFRPLTPPIGAAPSPSNMEIFQNYALQNPDEFQKLLEGIRQQTLTEKPPVEKEYDKDSFIRKVSNESPLQVDELEYDPYFLKSKQTVEEAKPKDQPQRVKKQTKKPEHQAKMMQSQMSFKELKKLWEQSQMKRQVSEKTQRTKSKSGSRKKEGKSDAKN